MKRVLILLLVLIAANPVKAQTDHAVLTVLDRASKPITQTVDGNTIQATVTLVAVVQDQTAVEFYLDEFPVADCAIEAGSDSCTTASFRTLGWYWHADASPRPEATLRAEMGGVQIAETTLAVSPRPVVLVHGFISTADKFKNYVGSEGYLASIGLNGFAVGDGQANGEMNSGNLLDPSAPTLTLEENAIVLDGYIEGVKSQTGAERVDIIGHSMGGLVTRVYLARVMNDDDVAQLVQLGTPNGGSPCGGALASLGFFLPASIELQPGYIQDILNPQLADLQGVPIRAVAGTLLSNPAASPCSGVPSDTSVSLESVQSIPLAATGQIRTDHESLIFSQDVFEQHVRGYLQTSPEEFASMPASQAVSSNADRFQFSKTYSGHLEAGETIQVPIPIDPNVTVASFGLYDTTRSIQVSVQGASGKTLELDFENQGFIIVNDPETMVYLGYGFENPKPGAWVVTIQAPAQPADYALYARFEGGASLEVVADNLLPQAGTEIQITAQLTGSTLSVDSVEGTVRRPDGRKEALKFIASGEDFVTSYVPELAGLYYIEVNALGRSGDGFVIDRGTSLVVQARGEAPEKIAVWRNIVIVLAILLAPVILLTRSVIRKISKHASRNNKPGR